MPENKGTRADLPPEGGLNEVKYDTSSPFDPDSDLEYTGEGGDGQEERVGDGTQS